MLSISKVQVARVSFWRSNWLTLHCLSVIKIGPKNCNICLLRDLKFSKGLPILCALSFLSYWIGCNHLPLLMASLLHIVEIPQDVDQYKVLIVLILAHL